MKSNGDETYELYQLDIYQFIYNFLNIEDLEHKFTIKFSKSFDGPNITYDNSNLKKILGNKQGEILNIYNLNNSYIQFGDGIHNKINIIDHIELHTYEYYYEIECLKEDMSKYKCTIVSNQENYDDEYSSSLSLFHRQDIHIQYFVEFKVNNDFIVAIAEFSNDKYIMMNSRDRTAEFFNDFMFEKLNLDFVASSIEFTFIKVKWFKEDYGMHL